MSLRRAAGWISVRDLASNEERLLNLDHVVSIDVAAASGGVHLHLAPGSGLPEILRLDIPSSVLFRKTLRRLPLIRVKGDFT